VNAGKPATPGSAWRAVAVALAIALACAGVVSADRAGLPRILGAAAGAAAALLGVLALPSFPTRRTAIALLAFGGLAIARHAAIPGVDVGVIVVWAAATLVALPLVDRAQAEATPALPASPPLPNRAFDTLRVSAVLAVAALVTVIAFAPAIAQAMRRDVTSGRSPTNDDVNSSASSLRSSKRLDMTSRPRLSDAIVFTVQADRPDFWRGEVWDVWDGTGWERSPQPGPTALTRDGRHIQVRVDPDDVAAGTGRPMHQTFHIEAGFSNVVFAAPTPVELESDQFVVGRADGTMALIGGFGHGATYSVVSRRALATEATLRAANARPVPQHILRRYAQVPVSTARVRRLAAEITATAPTAFDKVRAIEQWLGANTKYSLDAPLSRPGEDVVDHFVFDSRRGWCEQVASTLAVMLRSVGVPARVATGFVTGHHDPLTGRYVVRERDAHAWTEVYFPGVGWQGFDPTASVPLAGEAATAKSWFERAHAALPVLLVVAVVGTGGVIAFGALLRRLRRGSARRRSPSWAATMLRRLERLGRRAGVTGDPGQTVVQYARSLAVRVGEPRLAAVGAAIDTDAFSAHGAASAERVEAEQALTQIETAVRRQHSRRRKPRVIRSIDSSPTVKGVP
jgi:transglutaminase-like putative cysteine protease